MQNIAIKKIEIEGDFIITLSKSEYEVLSLIWKENRGLTASEINIIAIEKSWKDASIHLIINSLLDKGAIIVDGMVRSGRTYSRIFKYAISPEDYSLMQLKQNANFVKDKKLFFTNLFVSLFENEEISMDIIEKLKNNEK